MNHYWHDTLGDYYGKKLSQDEALRWQSDLVASLPGLQEEEIDEAVKWSSRTQNRPDRRAVTLQDLRSWIMAFRDDRHSDYGPDLKCRHCSDGWTPAYRTSGPYKGIAVDIPCVCERGGHWMDLLYPETDNGKMRKWAQAAIKGAAAIDAKIVADGNMIRDEQAKAKGLSHRGEVPVDAGLEAPPVVQEPERKLEEAYLNWEPEGGDSVPF